MSDKPSTQINENAKNPNGQCGTMSGTTQTFTPPLMPSEAKPQAIDPCSTLGYKSFDKK